VTTLFVGAHYEKSGAQIAKYYFAGASRIAVRTNGTLSYLLGDHLGSSSVTANASGVKTASALYKAFGETRFSSGNLGTDYKFTGQREQAELGLYFYGARWYDPSLSRFVQADTVVPVQTQGTQAWDRYAYVNNNPVRYNDPTGHSVTQGDGGGPNTCTNPDYCENGKPKPPEGEDDPITDFILSLPLSDEFYSNVATGLDIAAWAVDAYAVGVVIYGGVAGAGIAAPFVAVGVPEVPVVTGAAGAAIAELAVQPLLNASNMLATFSTAATVIAETKTGVTNIDQGKYSTTVLNSAALTAVGWANKEAFISITIQTVAVTNDFGWTSLPWR